MTLIQTNFIIKYIWTFKACGMLLGLINILKCMCCYSFPIQHTIIDIPNYVSSFERTLPVHLMMMAMPQDHSLTWAHPLMCVSRLAVFEKKKASFFILEVHVHHMLTCKKFNILQLELTIEPFVHICLSTWCAACRKELQLTLPTRPS